MNEKNNKLLIKFLIYLAVFVLFTFLYFVSFRTGLFNKMNIFFYRGIFLLFTISLLLLTTLIVLKRNQKFSVYLNYYDLILAVTVFFSFNLIFFTHVPVTADRSLTVFMLGSMNQGTGGIYQKEDLERLFEDKYIKENDNVGKRIEEQLSSGNIKKTDDGYILTDRGKKLMNFYKKVADIFLITKVNFNSPPEVR